MKPAPFAFAAAADMGDALAALAAGGRPIAGGQSLGPMLNLRLARPSSLTDVSKIAAQRRVEARDGAQWIGAAVTHAEIEDGAVPGALGGWLAAAAEDIAHRAVRNRGTVGGSLAHADPAADWVIVMTALCASVQAVGPQRSRMIAMEDFVTGPFTTALAPDELIAAVVVPLPGPAARWGYWKFCRQVGAFASASAAVLDDPAGGRRRVALGALGDRPRVLAAPAALIDGRVAPAEVVSQTLPERESPERALHVTALKRALARMETPT